MSRVTLAGTFLAMSVVMSSGNVRGNVCGHVGRDVKGTISGRKWKFVVTPKEKAIRLIEEGRGDEAIQVLRWEGE
jgi:hypothetical protein